MFVRRGSAVGSVNHAKLAAAAKPKKPKPAPEPDADKAPGAEAPAAKKG